MTHEFSDSELEAYMDESLAAEVMARIEERMRSDGALAQRLVSIHGRRDAGVHSLGAIWRRARLSCPSREQLGSLLLGALPLKTAEYVRFHLETVGCRYCQANLADLESQHADQSSPAEARRRKYFQSSVGHLKKQ